MATAGSVVPHTASYAPVMAASAAATLLGLVALRAARDRLTGRLRWLFRAEAALGLGAGLCIAAGGLRWEIAIPVWLCLLSLCGFGLTATTALRRAPSRQFPRRPATTRTGTRPTGRPVAPLGLLAAVLVPAPVAAGLALAMALWLPLGPADRAMLGVVLWPVLWAGMSCRLQAVLPSRRAWIEPTALTLVAAFGVALPLAG